MRRGQRTFRPDNKEDRHTLLAGPIWNWPRYRESLLTNTGGNGWLPPAVLTTLGHGGGDLLVTVPRVCVGT